MDNKLFVGGLPYSITDGQLEEVFSPHGTVKSAQVITDKFSGKSRGFGFVEMSSDDEAQKAIAALSGSEVKGRPLTVNVARPMERLSGFGGGNGERRGWRDRR